MATEPRTEPSAEQRPADGRSERLAAAVGGALFFVSGAGLVLHVLTGMPLPLVLVVLLLVSSSAAAVVVWRRRDRRSPWVRRVAIGAVAGLAATVAYDAVRWLLVEGFSIPVNPYAALPLFGGALLGDAATPVARAVAGTGFHLLNGVAFGTAYVVWFGTPVLRRALLTGVAFGLALEAAMLAVYPGWLDIRAIREFASVTVAGHVAYGLALGYVSAKLLRRPA